MTVSGEASSTLWAQWFQVAVDRDGAARAARAEAVARKRHGQDPAKALALEWTASMVTVSAAAHSLDGLYGQLITPEIKADGPRPDSRREAHVRELLKRRFRIDGQLAQRWAPEFRWLFDLRDAAVHSKVQRRPMVPHPSGLTSTSQEWADYSAEAGMRALDLLHGVLTICAANPKPSDEEAYGWATVYSPVIQALETALLVSRDRQPLVTYSDPGPGTGGRVV